MSPFVRALLFKALRILYDDSLEINACLALCKAVKLSVRIALVLCEMSDGSFLAKVDGSLGFCTNTS